MKSILITGGTGLIGKKLISKLKKKHYNIYVLTRKGSYTEDDVNYLEWDPEKSKLDIKGINNLFSIIHLAGESINGSRWTKSYKKKMLDSRIDTTKLLFKTIKKLKLKPKSFISASATGYYRADTNLTQKESDPQGTGFLSGVVKKWEDDLSEPRANKLQMIAGLLNVSITWLIMGQGTGLKGPLDETDLSADMSEILVELRQTKSELSRLTEHLGSLEKRLRRVGK